MKIAVVGCGAMGSVYAALLAGRKAIGIELKPSYFSQAAKNIDAALKDWRKGIVQGSFEFQGDTTPDADNAEDADSAIEA